MTYRECDICGYRNDPDRDEMGQIVVSADKRTTIGAYIVRDVCHSCMPGIKGRLTEVLKRKAKDEV